MTTHIDIAGWEIDPMLAAEALSTVLYSCDSELPPDYRQEIGMLQRAMLTVLKEQQKRDGVTTEDEAA